MDKKQFLSTILNRKSVRSFTGKPLGQDDMEFLLRAGMAAPSAHNLQPWKFIAIVDRQILNSLAEKLPYAKMLFEAPAAIVVCGDLTKTGSSPKDYWVQDCSAASENILLAAEALGLGAVWTGVYPRAERVETVQGILNLPSEIVPLNVIPVGTPKGEHQAKDKFKSENIQWNRWP
ncbi:MAG: nitroreductase family protein [Tenuifilaceae bacterium]